MLLILAQDWNLMRVNRVVTIKTIAETWYYYEANARSKSHRAAYPAPLNPVHQHTKQGPPQGSSDDL
jgi:hypothetical protein